MLTLQPPNFRILSSPRTYTAILQNTRNRNCTDYLESERPIGSTLSVFMPRECIRSGPRTS